MSLPTTLKGTCMKITMSSSYQNPTTFVLYREELIALRRALSLTDEAHLDELGHGGLTGATEELTRDDWYCQLTGNENALYFVASHVVTEGIEHVVGGLCLDTSDSNYVIEWIAVDNHYQRCGVATTLMDAAFVYARKQGAKSISVSVVANNSAVDLYKGKGFEQTYQYLTKDLSC